MAVALAGTIGLAAASPSLAADTQPPTKPTGLAITHRAPALIALAWNRSTDDTAVAGYGIYNGARQINSTTSTRYTIPNLLCGRSYQLAVDAYDAAGNRSPQASIAAATAPCASNTLYLAPDGLDLNPCTRSAPCATFQRAYDLAHPGDTVILTPGSYSTQTVTGKKPAGPTVVFRPAIRGSVTISDLDIYATWFELRDVSAPNGVGIWGSSDHTILRNIDMDGSVYIAGAQNLSIIGGDIGPSVDAQSWITHDNGVIPRNVLIQGVHFHDFTVSDPSVHSECMLVIAGIGLTFDGDTWTNCAIFDLSFGYCCSSPAPPTNVVIQNNFFGASIQDEAHVTLQFNTNLNPVNYTIRYNSAGGPFMLDQGQPVMANIRAIANATPPTAYCGARIGWSYNVFTGWACAGSNNKVVSDLGFANADAGDFHLTASAPEIDAGNPSNYPPTDWDGQLRPMGSKPDAGADEAR